MAASVANVASGGYAAVESADVVAPDGLPPGDERAPADWHVASDWKECVFCKKRFGKTQQKGAPSPEERLHGHLENQHRREALFAGLLDAKVTAVMLAAGEVLRIAYEDDWLAVVVKPQLLPTAAPEGVTLARAHWLLSQLAPSSHKDARKVPVPCHRLDADTGGLIILGKTTAALQSLSLSFRDRDVKKRYRALVHGQLEKGSTGIVDVPLDGKPAQTRFAAVGSPAWVPRSDGSGGWVSTVDLWPLTGRTHQLRRHLANQLGHPIVGDRAHQGRYKPTEALAEDQGRLGGSDEAVHTCDQLEGPLFLWSLGIDFLHPDGTEVELWCEAADPNCNDAIAPQMGPRRVAVSIDEPVEFQAFKDRGAT